MVLFSHMSLFGNFFVKKEKSVLGIDIGSSGIKIVELKKELMKLKSQVARGTPPENPGKIRSLKRNVAKILTMLSKKKQVGGGE